MCVILFYTIKIVRVRYQWEHCNKNLKKSFTNYYALSCENMSNNIVLSVANASSNFIKQTKKNCN